MEFYSEGETMGRPINGKWFGIGTGNSQQIIVNGVMFSDGTVFTNAYIIKQTGSSAYLVQDTGMTHAPEIVFMVNAASTSALLPSQCFILATPFGGSALPCAKIAQFRVDIYNVANTIPTVTGGNISEDASGITSYSWSTIPANALGEANLVTSTGSILSITPGVAGHGYFTAPSVTFTGAGGSGAAATATVANGAVTGYTITSAGSGYATGSMVISAPPAAVTATCANGTETGGVVTLGAITVTSGGGYYSSVPTVTIGGGGTGATAVATIAAGRVTAVTITAGGTGYNGTVTITVAAPPASVTATATATVAP